MKQSLDSIVKSLSSTERLQLIELLNPKPKAYTRADALAEIDTLPQTQFIADLDMHHWLDKVQEYDPHRMAWHVRRLRGFGGSEIGTLWMALRDQFHPFHSCTDVVRTKWLMDEPLAPEGNLQRGSMMEDPILKVKFREGMVKKYAAEGKTVKFRDDLFDKFMNFVDPDPRLSWLIGSPDDILEVDGELIIVDYKAPTSGTIAAYAHYPKNKAPIYYEAQLHHYSTIAQKLGLKVASTMLASLDYDKFEFDLRYIPLRPQFQQELLDAGTFYWEQHVLTGIPPNPSNQKAFTKDVDLPPAMQELATQYAVLSTIMNSAKKARDTVQTIAANTATPIDTQVDVIVSGMVNVEAQRVYDHSAIAEQLTHFGIDITDAYKKNGWSQDALLNFVKKTLNITDENDPALDVMRNKNEETGTYDTVDVQALVQLGRKHLANLAPYIKSETAHFTLSRSKTGIAPPLRDALASANAIVETNAITELTNVFNSNKAQLVAALSAAQTKPKPAI